VSRAVPLMVLLVLAGCQGGQRSAEDATPRVPAMQLTSSAFSEGAAIPKEYTGDGPDVSPPLRWCTAPVGTKTFALICDDPDAPRGTWVHWVLFNLPADAQDLPEGASPKGTLPGGTRQGKNDFGRLGYGGPAPPPGKAHRYFFKLYALDTSLDLQDGGTKQQVEEAMKGHVRAEGRLMGTYGR
jgi:Raf kinase inhibitor-like YbhB/YbcL family protein